MICNLEVILTLAHDPLVDDCLDTEHRMDKKTADTADKRKDAHDHRERRVTAANLRSNRAKAEADPRVAKKSTEDRRAKTPLGHPHPVAVDIFGGAELFVARAF